MSVYQKSWLVLQVPLHIFVLWCTSSILKNSPNSLIISDSIFSNFMALRRKLKIKKLSMLKITFSDWNKPESVNNEIPQKVQGKSWPEHRLLSNKATVSDWSCNFFISMEYAWNHAKPISCISLPRNEKHSNIIEQLLHFLTSSSVWQKLLMLTTATCFHQI